MNQALNQRDMFFKWLCYAGATLLLVLVQSLVLNRICVWGVHPFLPPLIAAITAMLEGPGVGTAFAGVFGLLCDLTMPGIIPCFYTLAFLAAALLAAVIAKRFLSQGFLCAVLCAGLSLLVTDLLHTLLLTCRPVSDGAGGRRDCGAVAAGVSAAAQRSQPYPEIGGVL